MARDEVTKRKRMGRIVLIEPNGHGGHASFVDSLSRVLRRRYRVLVVTRARTDGEWRVPAVRLQARTSISLYWKIFVCLLKLLRNGDVVHFQNVSALMAIVVVLVRFTRWGVELADTVHNVEPHRITVKQWLDCILQRALVKLGAFTDVFVLAETSLAYGYRLERLLRPEIRVVPHQSFIGRRCAESCMARRRQRDRLGDPLRVLFFGVVRADKGVKEFLAAAESIGGIHIDLRIMGSFLDYDLGELQMYAGAVSNFKVIPGFAAEQVKSEAFEWCDFCVLPHMPSFRAGSGTLVDACERAVPVIAVSGSSVAARVRIDSCGIVLPRNEPEQWPSLLADASTPSTYGRFLDAIDRLIVSGWVNDEFVVAKYNYASLSAAPAVKARNPRELNRR